MWQWSRTLSSPSSFVHIWQVVALLNDRNSVAVSNIGFGVAMYSSNNCLASCCNSRMNLSAAYSLQYDERLWEVRFDTAYYFMCKTALDVILENVIWRSTANLQTLCRIYISIDRFQNRLKSACTTKGAGNCFWMLVNWHLGSSGNLFLCAWQQSVASASNNSWVKETCRHCLQQ